MRYVLVNDSDIVVGETQIADASKYTGPYTLVPCDYNIEGFVYNKQDGTFSPPIVPRNFEEAKQEKIRELNQKMAEEESNGTNFNGYRFATDKDSQIKYLGILVSSMIDPTFTTQFKTMNNEYVTLTNSDVVGLSMHVKSHIQACFDNDASILTQINAATSVESLDAIDITAGWPS